MSRAALLCCAGLLQASLCHAEIPDMQNLLKRFEQIEKEASHPVLARHARSIRSLIRSEWARTETLPPDSPLHWGGPRLLSVWLRTMKTDIAASACARWRFETDFTFILMDAATAVIAEAARRTSGSIEFEPGVAHDYLGTAQAKVHAFLQGHQKAVQTGSAEQGTTRGR